MAEWYDKSCEDCGATIHVCTDWDNPPRFCKSCKESRAAKWYEKACENCGGTIRANRDWDSPPKYCDKCRSTYGPKDSSCNHCGKSFVIPTGTQIKCKQNGWDLPKKCSDCRELFKHKPFKTVKESTIFGNTVFRTYNRLGQLIAESRDEKTVFENDRRRHTSPTGSTTGFTRNKETIFGTPYRETTRPDGSIKSRSTERTTIFGKKYTESTGGRLRQRTRPPLRKVGGVRFSVRLSEAVTAIPLPISPAISADQGVTGHTADCYHGHRRQFIKHLRLPKRSAGGDVGNGMGHGQPGQGMTCAHNLMK